MSYKAQRTPFSSRDTNTFSKSQRSNGHHKSEGKVVKVYVPKEESSTQNFPEQNEIQLQPEVTETKVVVEAFHDKENDALHDNGVYWQNVESNVETTENAKKTEAAEPVESAEAKSQKKRIRKKKDSKDQAEDENENQQDTNLQASGVKSQDDGTKQIEEETKQLPPQKKGKKAAAAASGQRKSSEEEADKLDETQKKIRNARKKLKQIELLEEKKRKGEPLNEDEIAKIRSKKDILILIKDLSIK